MKLILLFYAFVTFLKFLKWCNSPVACFWRSLLRMLVASKPALSHSCRGITSRALATAPISSCSLPAMVRECSRRTRDNSISMAPPPVRQRTNYVPHSPYHFCRAKYLMFCLGNATLQQRYLGTKLSALYTACGIFINIKDFSVLFLQWLSAFCNLTIYESVSIKTRYVTWHSLCIYLVLIETLSYCKILATFAPKY
jgi:hypothetical protein